MSSRLANVRIVVTRAAHQAEELAAPLRAEGADVLLLPMIGITGPRDPERLRIAAASGDSYKWIIFTSANAVEAFGSEVSDPGSLTAKIATVGGATRDAAEARGFRVSITPQKYVAESLVDAFSGTDLTDARVLIPRAEVARDVVPDALRKRGALVDVVEAYRNIIPPEAADQALSVFRDPLPDWILFASSSAVDHLARLCSVDLIRRMQIATIGPVTSATVRHYGLNAMAEAQPHTVDGLVKAVLSVHMGS